MIPHFLVFSFLPDFEKIKIKTSSGYENSGMEPTDKPGWTWNDYSRTPGLWVLQEGWGSWWISSVLAKKHKHCEKSSGRVLVGTQLAGVFGGMLMTLCWREPGAQWKRQSWERACIWVIFSSSHFLAWCLPQSLLWARKQWIQSLNVQAAQIKNCPSRHQERLVMRRMRDK